jgi:hypothetical protein
MKEHHGIGHYWCDNCREWVWGESGRSYIDIIHVYREKGTAYTAYSSGVPDERYPATQTWESNVSFPLDQIEADLGHELRDGRQDPWIRMWWPPR